MTIVEKMKADLKQAMKDKDEARKNILRIILGDVATAENRKGQQEPLSDEQAAKIIQKVIGSNDEVLGHLNKDDNRHACLLIENKILAEYLPKSMTEKEVFEALSGATEQLKSAKGDGPATGIAMGMLKKTGKAVDGALVAKVVKIIRSEPHVIEGKAPPKKTLEAMAEEEDKVGCVSVGGLYVRLGLYKANKAQKDDPEQAPPAETFPPNCTPEQKESIRFLRDQVETVLGNVDDEGDEESPLSQMQRNFVYMRLFDLLDEFEVRILDDSIEEGRFEARYNRPDEDK